MTFEVLEGSILELSTWRLHKSATFEQTQLVYQFEVHFLDLVFRVSLLVRCVCVHSGVSVRGGAAWLHCTGLLPYCHAGRSPAAPRLAALDYCCTATAGPPVLLSSACAEQNQTQSDP